MTYDDWKSRDDTPEPEPDWYCDSCHHYGRRSDECGCPCCSEDPAPPPGYEEPSEPPVDDEPEL